MSKKGQVTVFMVLGFISLLVFGIIVGIRSYSQEQSVGSSQEQILEASQFAVPVKSYVESCLEKTGEEAIVFIGEHGGYYKLPKLSEPQLELPYYFYDNISYLLTKEELEKQLSNYIDNELFFCLGNFGIFKRQGYNIKQGDVSTITKVTENKVKFEVNLPVEVAGGTTLSSLDSFSTSISSRLGTIYDMVQKLMNEQVQNPGSICVGCITIWGIERDLRTEMYYLNEGEIMFVIVDEKVFVDGKPFKYIFINQYHFNTNENFGMQ